ncbi:MAG TPA: hypothetical protein VFP50_15420 [Anaeromyxobacteraceae bacterium]|nr:hypothetical protein [Anaeromyxobacteraceae bacterium]
MQPALEPEEPSTSEALGRGAAQGATMGFGDELQGAIQTLGDSSTPWYLRSPLAALADATSGVSAAQLEGARQVDAERAAAEGPGARLRRKLAEYRSSRDSARREDQTAREAHPLAYLGGMVGGGAATAPLLPGGAAKTAGQAAVQGAKLGAAAGLGGSGADLTEGEVGQALGDTALGGALGAAVGAGTYYLPKLVPAALQKGSELLDRLGLSQARRALRGGAGEIAATKPVSDAAVRRALEEGAIRFGGTTQGAAERLADLLDNAGGDYRAAVEALEKAGVVGPAKETLVAALQARANGEAANSLGSRVPGYFAALARKAEELPASARLAGEVGVVPPRPAGAVSEALARRVADAVPEGPNLQMGDLGEVIEAAPRPAPSLPTKPPSVGPAGGYSEVGEVIERPVERLGLTQAENIKRSLQDAARKEYTRIGGNTDLGQAKKEAAALLRQAVEDAVDQQAGKAPEAAAAFQPAKQRTGELIEALNAAEKGAARYANRKTIGLQDAVAMAGHASPSGKVGSLLLSLLNKSRGASSAAVAANLGSRALGGVAELLPRLGQGVEMLFPGVGRAALTAGIGGGTALEEAITQAMRSGKVTPEQAEQLRQQVMQADALRQ